ncbi:hypothetical protein [Streptacidiphilus fuscans]|uniref:Uncharacterized protein n=1 Tax=Streptacidiphilus fuscans TaxID=2789292 RepID=A0A931AX65_9ACTN|nr:hypothetical protein [Streptacidiphilus fuscans]MBF9067034.1 hypothetical protein [Streptacidiphilus fuscans]
MTRSEWSRRVLPTSPFAREATPAPPPVSFEAGDRVSHDKYGLGRVLEVADDEDAVIVDFGASRRRIPASSPALSKL